MRKFEITEDQIKKLASSTIGRDVYMHDWFPQAFEPDWEEVPFSSFVVFHNPDLGMVFGDSEYTCSSVIPLMVCVRQGFEGDYKIEDGKIWRRKP